MYWKRHRLADGTICLLLSAVSWILGSKGFVVFEYESGMVQRLASTWLGPTLSLFGLFSATVAFMFTVIDKPEFMILRKSSSQSQLWEIFQANLFWLCACSVTALMLSLSRQELVQSHYIGFAITFILAMAITSLCKFTWVMIQIVSVRVAASSKL